MVTFFASEMASLLGEQLYEIADRGPPPPKDFFQLVVTKKEVILKSWIISLMPGLRGAPPQKVKALHEDFLQDRMLRQKVGGIFGQRVLDHTVLLCEGKFDYLQRLPDDILLRILSYLSLKDTTKLAQVSHKFRKLCNSEEFWEQVVRNCKAELTENLEGLANAMGWRRMFFTFFYSTGSNGK